jgi:hypothetical protein
LLDEILAEQAGQHVLIEDVFPVLGIAGPVLHGDIHHLLDGIGRACRKGAVGKEDGGSQKQKIPHDVIPGLAKKAGEAIRLTVFRHYGLAMRKALLRCAKKAPPMALPQARAML